MTIRRKLAALAALSLLLAPNLAHADEPKDKCDVPVAQQDEDCKEKRRGGFQSKFFSE